MGFNSGFKGLTKATVVRHFFLATVSTIPYTEHVSTKYSNVLSVQLLPKYA